MLSCEQLNRKCAVLLEQNLMNLSVLSEKDDLIELHVEWIAGDVLDDSRERLVLRQLFEVNGIVGREIFVFRFNACEREEKFNCGIAKVEGDATHRGALLSSRALAFYGIDLATFAFCRVT